MSTYNAVAEEYYIVSRHPTCNNFRAASKTIISSWLSAIPERATICEVGAGKSIVAELLLERGISLRQLLITDQSARMLKYSAQFSKLGASVQEADAVCLPIASESVDCLISSLGDPYNVPKFWSETARVLRSDGRIIFTVPAYAWATHFRSHRAQNFNEAEFDLMDGSKAFIPSFIYADCDQRNMIQVAGLKVIATRQILVRDLEGENLSPKLGLDRGQDGEIVSGYLIRKS